MVIIVMRTTVIMKLNTLYIYIRIYLCTSTPHYKKFTAVQPPYQSDKYRAQCSFYPKVSPSTTLPQIWTPRCATSQKKTLGAYFPRFVALPSCHAQLSYPILNVNGSEMVAVGKISWIMPRNGRDKWLF